MELTNEFSVAAPVSEAWPLLTDIVRIAPCVPGFQLKGSTDGEYEGTMKVKVGAVQTMYDCVIRFVELDEEHRRAVIAAKGQETRGQGGMTASITSTLTPDGDATRVRVVTDLNVTGRVAQFGRGILADVSNRLVKQFVKRLESTVLAEDQTPPADKPRPATGGDDVPPQPLAPAAQNDDALNLVSVAAGPLIKRLAPVLALVAVIGILFGWARARSAK